MSEIELNQENKELNQEKQDILKQILENTDINFFITGNAGTGKSLLLKTVRQELGKLRRPNIVVAPTGIAAFNINGRTIHSAFGFPPEILTPKTLSKMKQNSKSLDMAREMEVLIVDEISMVRADLFYAMDVFLQKARSEKSPFGGVQVLLFGDMAQLPPVVGKDEYEDYSNFYQNRYFFSTECVKDGYFEYTNLTENFRQSQDYEFQEILNRIRTGSVGADNLGTINKQVRHLKNEDAITLTTRNNIADNINKTRLNQLPGDSKIYSAVRSGNFKKSVTAPVKLELKLGARVMLVRNYADKNLVNGSMGVVQKLSVGESFKDDCVEVLFDNGQLEKIMRATWGQEDSPIDEDDTDEMSLDFEFEDGSDVDSKINADTEITFTGSYRQIPLILAWAISIHKSQGKTFEKINIDWGSGAFEHGHAYVALSRCTRLAGITLLNPLKESDIMVDPLVADFNRG